MKRQPRCFIHYASTSVLLALFFLVPPLSCSAKTEALSASSELAMRSLSAVELQIGAKAQHARSGVIRAGRSLRSSFGQRSATVASALTSASIASQHRLTAPYVAPYIPVIGLANVTTPTAYPPPPPLLNARTDMQPLDTAIGNFIAGSFIQDPTVTPPPSQDALDVAFACPALLQWGPGPIQIDAPDPCNTGKGEWIASGQFPTTLLKWDESCGAFENTLSLVTYSMPNGDLFGYSKTRMTIAGNYIDLIDCGHNTKFTVQEKVYEQRSDTGSSYFLQYFIQGVDGITLAKTPYLTLAQDTFEITDPNGLKIADINRLGEWDPTDTKCREGQGKRKWQLTFSSAAPGIWSIPTNQWPIAEMMTMMAFRDVYRRKNGMVGYSTCETIKITVIVATVLIILGVLVIFGLMFMMFYRHKCFTRLQIFERTLCPRRMYKPEKYEGN